MEIPISAPHMNQRLLTRIEGVLWAWMSAVMRQPRKAIAFLIAVAIIGFLLALNGLGVNSDTSQMVSSKLDYRQAQLDFEAAFPDEENRVTVIVRARSEDEADAFTKLLVDEMRQRTDVATDVFAASADPYLIQNGLLYLDSDELDEVLANISAAGPVLKRLGRTPDMDRLYLALADAFEPLEAGEPLSEALERAIASVAETIDSRLDGTPEPLSWQEIFVAADEDDNPDLHQRIVSISPVLDLSRLQPARPAVFAIDKAVKKLVSNGDFEVTADITGNAVLRTEELNSVRDGIGVSLSFSVLFIIILLMVALRSWVLVGTSLLALLITILITAGFAALMYEALNLVSIAFMVLLIGLGIDFMIHLAMHVQEERTRGLSCHQSIMQSNHHIGAALALCAPTSAIAFFAFAPTYFTGMTQLGIVSGFGVLVAFVVAVTLLPAVFALLPPNSGIRNEKVVESSNSAFFASIGLSGPVKARIAVSMIVLGGLSLFLMPSVRFDADPMALRDPDAPSVTAFNMLFDDEDTQPYNLSLLLPDAAAVDQVKPQLEALSQVREVIGPEDLIPKEQYDKLDAIDIASIGLGFIFESNEVPSEDLLASASDRLNDALKKYPTPATLALTDSLVNYQAALSENASLRSEVEGDIFRFWGQQYERLEQQIYPEEVTFEALPNILKNRFVAADGRLRLQIEPTADLRNEASRTSFVHAVRELAPNAAGSARSVLESGRVISRAMLIAMFCAWFAVALLLVAILRDGLLVSVILFSLVLAAVLTTATAVLIGVPFNFANVIAVPLLVGVGADSGIHLGMRARREATAADVYETSTPRAVFFSAVTTICSFGTLMFSAHRGVASMGILLSLAIGFTLICTILVQPWLLDKLGAGKSKPKIPVI